MSKNFLIGIGGTGARIVEAVVNMCSMGFGPDELTIFMVDPDAGNGNLERTKSLLSSYQKCRGRLNSGNSKEKNQLFKTKINMPEPFVWDIFEKQDTTLSSYINYTNMYERNQELADFASVLFSESELNTKLDKGFRGHPSIGAVVMANIPDNSPFKIIWDSIRDAGENEAKVFLVGSVFGGTGAAGFPTFGSREILKYNEKAKLGDNSSRILLGGALVLPYFSFSTADTTEKMYVTNTDFPIATKAALQYYNEKELGFDQIYFVGASDTKEVGNFSVGSKTQKNLPHYIEIVAGLSAFDFYDQDPIKGTPEKQYYIACKEGMSLNWDSLPFTRKQEHIGKKQIDFRSMLCKMTVFALSYSTYGVSTLEKAHDQLKEAWYRSNFKYNKEEETKQNPRSAENKELISEVQKFCNRFLYWVSAIDLSGDNTVNLINSIEITANRLIGYDESTFVPKDPSSDSKSLGTLLKGVMTKNWDWSKFQAQSLNTIEIDKTIPDGASKYIQLFYEAASDFSDKNYTLK